MSRSRFAAMAVLVMLMAASASAADFQVIVNPANTVKTLSVEELAKIFMKKTVKWDDGVSIAPVDQVARSPVREAFTTLVHGKQVNAVVSYWQQQIFSGGQVPPPEKATDASVIAYVKANPGAIGYIAPGVAAEGVRVVPVR
ncbi:MAG: substrate-binding domain-containing protein [Vicinamibacteria bacterium]|nr:substrate-binding domain-containing protein [Vicinamibacteria bacterium]